MITQTDAIKKILQHYTHPDLAQLYNKSMECQVNVAQDGGQRIDGDFKGKMWQAWTDGVQKWYPIRIPKNANAEPVFEEKPMSYDLEAHVEAIGMTGFDWEHKKSRWVFFDFDAMVGHSDRHTKKLTDAELQEIIKLTSDIPWVTIRKSTGGKGLHLYVFINPNDPENLISNHNEHAAVARAILGKMSALVGYDFQSKIDTCGGNGWVFHRKMKNTNSEGLKLIKQGVSLDKLPPNWKDHLHVIKGTRKRTLPLFNEDDFNKLINVDKTEQETLFEEITTQRNFVKLDDVHRKLIKWMEENQKVFWYDQDHHIFITHTVHLKEVHEDLGLKGLFDTHTTHSSPQNAFMSPLRNGAWVVRRYGLGVQEAANWFQDGVGYYMLF